MHLAPERPTAFHDSSAEKTTAPSRPDLQLQARFRSGIDNNRTEPDSNRTDKRSFWSREACPVGVRLSGLWSKTGRYCQLLGAAGNTATEFRSFSRWIDPLTLVMEFLRLRRSNLTSRGACWMYAPSREFSTAHRGISTGLQTPEKCQLRLSSASLSGGAEPNSHLGSTKDALPCAAAEGR